MQYATALNSAVGAKLDSAVSTLHAVSAGVGAATCVYSSDVCVCMCVRVYLCVVRLCVCVVYVCGCVCVC